MKYLIFFFTVVLFSSCTDLDKGKQLDSISKMEKTLDSIQTVLNENKIDTLVGLKTAAGSVEIRIKNYYYSDTINLEFGKKMDSYKLMRRSLGPLGKSFSVIKNGVIAERTSLLNLKKDIENGDGLRKKYDEYILFEQGKVDQLKLLLSEYIKEKNKTMKTFNELHQELYDFSMMLYQKNKDIKRPQR